MREIKFRAWDGKAKLMITSTMLSPRFISLSGKSMYIESERMECFGGGTDLRVQHFDSLMQFTGLKDKNGKDIFEGDIVKWGDNIETVSYNEANAAFETETSCLDSTPFEVIGNIYESPELLNGASNG